MTTKDLLRSIADASERMGQKIRTAVDEGKFDKENLEATAKKYATTLKKYADLAERKIDFGFKKLKEGLNKYK